LNSVAEHEVICSTHVDEIWWRIYIRVQLYKTRLQWKLCILATSFSFHSHPTYTGGQLMVAREKYSLICNCFVNILAAIILPQY
jgi:ribosomal protein L31